MTPHAPRLLFVPSEEFARCIGDTRQLPMPEREPQPRDVSTETSREPGDRHAAHGLVAGAFRLLGIFV